MGREIEKKHAILALIFGIIKVVMACITLICSFVVSSNNSSNAGLTPYWAGAPCLIPGILGVIAGCTKNYCVMIAYMVMSIISCVISSISFIIIAMAVGVWSAMASSTCRRTIYGCTCEYNGRVSHFDASSNCNDGVATISALLYVLVIVLAITAGILLAGSILGCIATCCSRRETTGQVIQPQAMQGQNMQQMQAQAYPPPAYSQNAQAQAGALPTKY